MDLIRALFYGTNKNRYAAVFHPRTQHIERVRCIQGHSSDVNPHDLNWTLVNMAQNLRVFHVTYPHCVDGITQNGLIPARLNTAMPIGGRAEIYLKPLSPGAIKQISPRPGCTVMCTVATELCGEVTFYETPEGSRS